MQSAQRYPRDYDGIIAAAPAMYWAELVILTIWAGVFMDVNKQYPYPCELDQITKLGINACDKLDGVLDGLIADTEACRAIFNPYAHVNTTFHCADTGKDMQLSYGAANVANAVWTGPTTTKGDFIWYGFEIGSDLKTIAPTICDNSTCTSGTAGSLEYMYELFVGTDESFGNEILGQEDFDFLALNIRKTFAGNAEANITNLDEFQRVGGKMLTYHGLVRFLLLLTIPERGKLTYVG